VSPKKDRTHDGIVFDSKWEMNAYKILKDEIGTIHFTRSPKYELQPKFRDASGKAIRAIHYIGDFLVNWHGHEYLVDTKGFETPVFKMKEKMFKYIHKQEIIKIKSKKKMFEFIAMVKGRHD